MLPAEPGSTPPPPWSAMSNGIDEPTHVPSSSLRASPRMHEPRRGTRHGSCSSRARPLPVLPTRLARSPRPSSVPGNLSRSMRTRFARAEVAGNFIAFFPALLSPALSWRLRRGRAAAPPTPPAERRPGCSTFSTSRRPRHARAYGTRCGRYRPGTGGDHASCGARKQATSSVVGDVRRP